MPIVGGSWEDSGRTRSRAFPKDLSKIVAERWNNLVAGDYVVPPLPPNRLLRELMETVYLSAAIPEEGQYAQFNIIATPLTDASENSSLGQIWPFETPRPFSIDEIRRLAPAVDFKKSAILTKWNADRWHIAGLVDLGTSWARARIGLQYHYKFPACLFLQIDRVGRIRAYQGQYLVGELEDGQIKGQEGLTFVLGLHGPTHNGLIAIQPQIKYPELEEPRESHDFQFIAFWNTFAALANCVSEEAHGGAIVIAPARKSPSKQLRIKYQQKSPVLRDVFIDFMNIRHRVADHYVRMERGETSVESEMAVAELQLNEKHLRLVEAIRFVARLSCCDGAIVISEDLRLLGFGAEIRSELKPRTEIREVVHDLKRIHRPLNLEEFGQRHRSAIKLVSREPKYSALVVSQDGPISIIWSEKQNLVNVRRGANLVNLNMPWA